MSVVATVDTDFAAYLIRHADDNVVIGQRLSECISSAPELEEDLAIGNFALDHIGVARHLYAHAAAVEGAGRTEDDLAFLRTEREFTNVLLVEQPNGDFAQIMARQLLFDAYQLPLWEALAFSQDETTAGIAAKAAKEARYHLRHSSRWVVRLGDGTDESHRRMQLGIDAMWRFTAELLDVDGLDLGVVQQALGVDASSLRDRWDGTIAAVLAEATLDRPADPYQARGGRAGRHTEHLGHLLSEMQWMQRTYPGLQW